MGPDGQVNSTTQGNIFPMYPEKAEYKKINLETRSSQITTYQVVAIYLQNL